MKLLAVVRPLKKFQCINHFSDFNFQKSNEQGGGWLQKKGGLNSLYQADDTGTPTQKKGGKGEPSFLQKIRTSQINDLPYRLTL